MLLDAIETTKEEAHPQDEQQVGEYAANQRLLDDVDLVLCKSQNRDNEFNRVAST